MGQGFLDRFETEIWWSACWTAATPAPDDSPSPCPHTGTRTRGASDCRYYRPPRPGSPGCAPRCGEGRDTPDVPEARGLVWACPPLNAPARHQGGHVPMPPRMPVWPAPIAQPPGAGKRMVQLERVDPAHQGQIHGRHGRRLVVRRCPRARQKVPVPPHREGLGSGDHRRALSHPALVRAPAPPSCSRARGPIVAWRTWKSGAFPMWVVPPNTSATRSRTCRFQAVIGVRCPAHCSAPSASVFSPLHAAP